MNNSLLGHTASLITLYALHALLPKVYIDASEVNGPFFSFAIDASKRIGPEFREFLFESIQYTIRSDLPIRSFSMMRMILIGYLEKEKKIVDSRLEELLYSENSDEKEIVEVVEIGGRFCTIKSPEADFLPSTSSLKWIEPLPIAYRSEENSSLISIRAVVGTSAKQVSKRRGIFASFFLSDEQAYKNGLLGNIDMKCLFDNKRAACRSLLFEEAFEAIDRAAFLFQSKKVFLPKLDDAASFDFFSPQQSIIALSHRWKTAIDFLSKREEVGFCSLDRLKFETNLSALIPLSSLEEGSCLSCFYPKCSIELLQKFFDILFLFLSQKTIYGSLRFICEVASCYSEKEFMGKKDSIGIFQNIQKRVSSSDPLYKYRQDKSIHPMHICCTFSSFLLEEMEIPVPRSAILIFLDRKGSGAEREGQFRSVFFPFFSYEKERLLLEKSPFSDI